MVSLWNKEVMARIVLLDKDRLLPGEDAFVQDNLKILWLVLI